MCDNKYIDQVIQLQYTNNCIQKSYQNIKSAIICYVNNVSETFSNLNGGIEYDERGRMNVIIETFIAQVHQSCGVVDDVNKLPSFHLVIQEQDESDNDIHSLGEVDPNSNKFFIINDSNTIPNLHPNKLSIIRDCQNYRNGDEILYYYIISFQMLYDKTKSSLFVKISNSSYGSPISNDKCLFPILVNKSKCTYQLFNFTPESDDEIWTKATSIYTHIHNLLINNRDLKAFSAEIDKAITKCKTTGTCLAKREELMQYL